MSVCCVHAAQQGPHVARMSEAICGKTAPDVASLIRATANEMSVLELQAGKTRIEATGRGELGVRALLDDSARLQHENAMA